MTTKPLLRLAALLACLAMALPAAAAAPVQADRAGLVKLVDDYFAALVAHDPARLPFARGVKFVENVQRRQPGEGLWQTASKAPASFRIVVPDPVSGEVGFMGMMEEDGKPLMIGLRLKVLRGEIIEAEHVLARNIRAPYLANLQVARPVFSQAVPAKQRMERWQAIGAAYSYYAAADFNDGTLAPMDKDCERRENGNKASLTDDPDDAPGATTERPNYSKFDCTKQFSTGMMAYIDSIDNVRVVAYDPVNGLVFGLSHFRHGMAEKVYPIQGVPGTTTREVKNGPFDLPAAHVFKVSGGKIHQIEAMGFAAPYDAPTGW